MSLYHSLSTASSLSLYHCLFDNTFYYSLNKYPCLFIHYITMYLLLFQPILSPCLFYSLSHITFNHNISTTLSTHFITMPLLLYQHILSLSISSVFHSLYLNRAALRSLSRSVLLVRSPSPPDAVAPSATCRLRSRTRCRSSPLPRRPCGDGRRNLTMTTEKRRKVKVTSDTCCLNHQTINLLERSRELSLQG